MTKHHILHLRAHFTRGTSCYKAQIDLSDFAGPIDELINSLKSVPLFYSVRLSGDAVEVEYPWSATKLAVRNLIHECVKPFGISIRNGAKSRA